MSGNRVLPVDRLVVVYNLALTVTWLTVVGEATYAPLLVAGHAVGLSLPWLITRMPAQPGKAMRVVRELYPLVFVAVFWLELDYVRISLDLRNVDAAVAAADRWLFGVHLHEVGMAKYGSVFVSEAMHLLYYAYYPTIYVPPIVLTLLGRFEAIRDMTFRLAATYLVCYLIYVLLPVDGPNNLVGRVQGPHTEGFFYGLVSAAQAFGGVRGASFPSSHVAGAVTIAFIAWRWLPRWAAVLLTLEAVGVVASTTFTQFHYAIDSVAGVVWALLLNSALAVPLWRFLGGKQAHAQAAPASTGSGGG